MTNRPEFKVKIDRADGREVWFPLLFTKENIDDKSALLTDDGEAVGEVVIEEGEPITDLAQACEETKQLFFEKKWTVSNGLVSFTKGAKEAVPVTPEIFGPAKSTPVAEMANVRTIDENFKRVTVQRDKSHAFAGSYNKAEQVAISQSRYF